MFPVCFILPPMLLFYISLFLLLAYGFLMQLYYRWWKRAPLFSTTGIEAWTPDKKITVIIPARNEASNIGHCLRSLLQQNYPAQLLEIIVVDDQSTDETALIVQSFQHASIRLIQADSSATTAPKKRAITTAIGIASGELIITTDADCTADPDWIKTVAYYHQHTDIVFIAAPVKMKDTGTLLSIFQTLDFLTMQGITAASAYKRFHHMCNGANLAYEKKAFEKVNGFSGIDSIASGDDMLLMHKISRTFPGKVGFLKTHRAIVETAPAISWTEFLQQRIRWASKATHYKDRAIFMVLLLVYLTNLLLLSVALSSIWMPEMLLYFLLLCVIKFLVEFPFVQSVAKFFHQSSLLGYLLLLQPLHILYIVLSGFLGQVKTYEWKGRRLK
jgi:cellulose synthase/poly-beta-1,6-N-acetylglucosamine synthase-like glycosyltransferase